MLVIQRREFRDNRQESVLIKVNGEVVAEVVVVRIRNDAVRLGFIADQSTVFVRSELAKKAEADNV